ncbi:MAG: PLP-dependent transferase, partial [Actinomycetota bacterium]
MDPEDCDPETWLVAAGRPSGAGSPLNTPIEAASTFHSDGSSPYARSDEGTASWRAFEELVGGLERGTAVSFASGMAAVSAVFAQVAEGGTVVIPADCYQGVAAMADEVAAAGRQRVHRLATDDTPGWVAAAGEADLLWFETPSNPLLVVGDLVALAAAPRRPGALLAVDNTFATPLNQRPLDLGADLSVQSATKLLGGHSDLLSGVVTTRSDRLAVGLRHHRLVHGATPG